MLPLSSRHTPTSAPKVIPQGGSYGNRGQGPNGQEAGSAFDGRPFNYSDVLRGLLTLVWKVAQIYEHIQVYNDRLLLLPEVCNLCVLQSASPPSMPPTALHTTLCEEENMV